MNQHETIGEFEEIWGDPALSVEDLAAVYGGDVRNSNGASWDNSSPLRKGVVQFAAAAGGVVAAGVTLVTAPISFPLALGAAAVAGIVAGFAAADAHGDIRNAKPDPEPNAGDDGGAGAAAAYTQHNQQVTLAGASGSHPPSHYSPGSQSTASYDAGALPYR